MHRKTVLGTALLALTALALAPGGCAPRFPVTGWPIEPTNSEHEIGNSGGEYQGFVGIPPYFHRGLDIMEEPAPDGPWVLNTRAGFVLLSLPGAGSLYNGITMLHTDGSTYQYWHLDFNSIQQAVLDASNNGTLLPADTQLAQLVPWTACSFHHLHYQVGDAAGNLDPIFTVTPRNDTTDPVLGNIYFVENTTSTRVPTVPGTTMPLLSGDVDVLLHAHDTQFGTETTGVMQLSYWVTDPSNGAQVKGPTTVRFSEIPADANAPVIYRIDPPFASNSDYCATEIYYYVLTNVDGDGNIISDASGFWDTTTLANGIYDVYAELEDPWGNTYRWSRPVEIAN
ncbi:MAG: hypothetical protein ACFCUT_21955 [Kiloniellaceae bacterium]